MEFKVKKGNFQKSENDSKLIMFELLIALIPIWIFGFYKNGITPFINGYGNFFDMLKPIFMVVIPALTGVLFEFLWYLLVKKEKKSIKYFITSSFAIIPGIFLGLILPVNTPYLIIIFGSFCGTIIGKMIYGGFGNNIFNPALIGRLFIIASYGAIIYNSGGYLNMYEQNIDAISGATPLTNFSSLGHIGTYEQVVGNYGSLWNFFFGTIPGALGETSALLCIIAFIYLTIFKAIKWPIPVTYILTVFLMTFGIGLINGEGIWFPLFNILSGGLMFGAVFMATDPVTSPITRFGQVVYGILLGLLTVSLRYLTSYPEAVLTSILLMNLLVPIVNKLSIKARFNSKVKGIAITILIVSTVILTFFTSTTVGKKEEVTNDKNFKVVDIKENQNEITYTVFQRGYKGVDAIKAKLTFKDDELVTIDVYEQTEDVYDMIARDNYLNKLIENQDDVKNVDAISGATYTCNFLKEMVSKTVNYHKENK